MIDALARALQDQPGSPVRLLRVTVAATGPLKVTLPGGTVVAGVAVTGLTYTVGQAAVALYAQPAVGPVFPTA